MACVGDKDHDSEAANPGGDGHPFVRAPFSVSGGLDFVIHDIGSGQPF